MMGASGVIIQRRAVKGPGWVRLPHLPARGKSWILELY